MGLITIYTNSAGLECAINGEAFAGYFKRHETLRFKFELQVPFSAIDEIKDDFVVILDREKW